MRNERLVVSRERLLEEVWGYDPLAMTNTIDVFISNLRRKLEEERRAAPPPHQARRRLRDARGARGLRWPDGQRPLVALPVAVAGSLAPRRRLGRADLRDPARVRRRRRPAGREPPARGLPRRARGGGEPARVRARRERRGSSRSTSTSGSSPATRRSASSGPTASPVYALQEPPAPPRSQHRGNQPGAARGRHRRDPADRQHHRPVLRPVRAGSRRARRHDQPPLAVPGHRGRRRRAARDPCRPVDRAARDAPDRRPHGDGAEDRHHPRPLAPHAEAGRRRRGRRAGPHPRLDAAESWTPRATRLSRWCTRSASSWRTPRTSCERR